MEELIRIVSISANGLNSPQKRHRFAHQLEKMNLDIICIQETQEKKM